MVVSMPGGTMQTWLAAIDDLPEIVSHGTVLIVAVAAITVGGVRERLAASGVLVEDLGSILVRLYLNEPSTIVATIAHSSLVLMVYAGMSWRWSHRWLIVLTSLQCLSLLLIVGRWIDTTIPHEVNSLVRDVVGWLLLLTLSFSTVQELRARYGGFVRPFS